MDLYFIKVRARSKGTAEEIIGYFFGKTNSAPDFDFLVVPLRYSNMLDQFTLEENLSEFKDKLAKLKEKLKTQTSVGDVTLAFVSYLNNVMNRRGKIPLGIEFTTAIKEGDEEVLKIIIADLLEEWSPKMEVFLKAEALTLEEYSALTFFDIQEDFSDAVVAQVYSRSDVADLPEVFPVIDPINGVSIVQFDVGDKIPIVVLNYGKYESAIKSKIPDVDTAKKAIEGTIVSKELVKIKGGTLYLVKVEIADGIVGKGLISPALKILTDEAYFLKKRSTAVREQSERQPGVKEIKLQVPPTTGNELLIAFMTTLLVTGALLIIVYIFTK
ncbi:DUF4899 domain-containing protein [Fervidobacterium thailandense]|uniref:DUF4899 domain-containing protein n=1 Tax=Fervidobacterium thailandense TaxID=1008305 RepID=A0A1E3G555_9BACT|nr:DUF4899 domain-containing protein [Fervidobacterium thailandense]ODN31272.1 hypothetical protein A4H02_00375 [Fervidobacterium thailandense]